MKLKIKLLLFFYGAAASLLSFPMEVDKLSSPRDTEAQQESERITSQSRSEEARGSFLAVPETKSSEITLDSSDNMNTPNAVAREYNAFPVFTSQEQALSASLDLTAIGQTAEGHDIIQIDTQRGSLVKKTSPDSVIRASEAVGSPPTIMRRKISFDPLPVEEETALALRESSKKASEPTSVSSQEIKKYSRQLSRQLKSIITNVELKIGDIEQEDPQRFDKIAAIYESANSKIKEALVVHLPLIGKDDKKTLNRVLAIYAASDPDIRTHLRSLLASLESESSSSEQDDSRLFAIKLLEISFFLTDIKAEADLISEEDPECSSKIAAHYNAAYLKRKAELQTFFSTIKGNEDLQSDKNVILNFGVMAIEVAELAFRSTNLEKMNPIKVEAGLTTHQEITQLQIPWESVPLENVKESDEQAVLIIKEVCNLVNNMKSTMKALSASDASISFLLRESHLLKAHSATELATLKEFDAGRKFRSLHAQSSQPNAELLNQASAELQQACDNHQKCYNYFSTLSKAPYFDSVTAKNIAVTDMLSLIQNLLEKDSQLITVLSRTE